MWLLFCLASCTSYIPTLNLETSATWAKILIIISSAGVNMEAALAASLSATANEFESLLNSSKSRPLEEFLEAPRLGELTPLSGEVLNWKEYLNEWNYFRPLYLSDGQALQNSRSRVQDRAGGGGKGTLPQRSGHRVFLWSTCFNFVADLHLSYPAATLLIVKHLLVAPKVRDSWEELLDVETDWDEFLAKVNRIVFIYCL